MDSGRAIIRRHANEHPEQARFMAVARTFLRDVVASGDSCQRRWRAPTSRCRGIVPDRCPSRCSPPDDLADGAVHYVNGGHPAPDRLDTAESVGPFGEPSRPMVGLLAGRKYPEGTGQLERG